MECERCHSKSEGYNLFDYCAVCSANLCPHCMAEGCCGNVPAESGSEADNGEEFEAAEQCVEADEGDSYDFTDPEQNPWILSDQEADQLSALRRSR